MTTETHHFPCQGCGARLEYAPGLDQLECQYCGQHNTIEQSEVSIEEQDFKAFLAQAQSDADTVEVNTVTCVSCGATSTASRHRGLSHCPFCGAAISAQVQTQRLIKPAALLPFKLTRNEAMIAFRTWIKDLSFAPNDLKQRVRTDSALQGVYTPYWTFDCHTKSRYSGERGDDHTVTETRRVTDAEGNEVEEEFQVTETEWTSASGSVKVPFDDVLVAANNTLPEAEVEGLEPWDLEALRPAQQEYMSGFIVEAYQIDLPKGFERAEGIMDGAIRKAIEADIGGDHQRISKVDTQHKNISFKHILLPIWICSYQHESKTYQFIINARTGEVQGQRPWSIWKIAALVFFIIFSLLMLIPPATPLGILMILGGMAYGLYALLS